MKATFEGERHRIASIFIELLNSKTRMRCDIRAHITYVSYSVVHLI